MHTVYAVTSGEYSDYRVHAIFENEDDAQTHIDALSRSRWWGASYDVQAFSFFPAGEQPRQRELWTYVTGGGRFTEKTRFCGVSWDYDEPEDSWDASEGRAGAVGPTLEQAKKVAQDRAARRLAEQHGIG